MKKDYPSDNMPLDSYACDSHVYKLKIILKAVFYRVSTSSLRLPSSSFWKMMWSKTLLNLLE